MKRKYIKAKVPIKLAHSYFFSP